MNTCYDVANYFLAMQDDEAGDAITNMKLQKLVYYAQGFHLAILGRALFEEHIEAWVHGPVVRELYDKYKQYGSDRIPQPKNFNFKVFSKDSREVLDEVYKVLGQYSAWKLRSMTHNEPPWKNAKQPSGRISNKAMKKYFSTLISEDEED